MITAFDILGVCIDATDDEIKTAYLQKVKIYGPERAPDEFKQIRSAFDLINTEKKRIQYQLFNNDMPSVYAFVEDSLSADKLQGTSEKLLAPALLESLKKFDNG
jgi:curved DNA-binding protein CbpA